MVYIWRNSPNNMAGVVCDLGVAARTVVNDKILLVREARGSFQDCWGLPKGCVDDGESPEAAVLRELEEETGLIGSNPELLMVMGEPTRDPRKHIVSIVYSVTTDDSEPNAGDDAADARYWPLQTVLDGKVPLAGDHMQIIKNWFNR